MKRSTFIRILKTIKQVSNNVSAIENFNSKALVVFKISSIIAETPIQQKAFRKLVEHASYFHTPAKMCQGCFLKAEWVFSNWNHRA